jgi:hypothetical protein
MFKQGNELELGNLQVINADLRHVIGHYKFRSEVKRQACLCS